MTSDYGFYFYLIFLALQRLGDGCNLGGDIVKWCAMTEWLLFNSNKIIILGYIKR